MRKMTNLSMLALVAFVFTVVGCSKNSNCCSGPTQLEENTTKSITFTIATPAGDPITLKAGTIHDQAEWTVKSLTMYQFNADGTKLMAIEPINMDNLTQTAEAEYTYTKEFTNEQTGTYRFLFIANDQIADVATGISQSDFEKKLMTQKLLSDGSSTSKSLLTSIDGTECFPMSGVALRGNSRQIPISGTTQPVKVELTRVVARVDVINHIPNLTITKVSLRNTNDQTTVFPAVDTNNKPTYEAPSTATKVAISKGYAEIATAGIPGIAGVDGAKIQKALYLYEGSQPTNEKDATSIVVTGTLKDGELVEYVIPFKESEVGYKPVTVKRNYLYTLRLGDNTPVTPNTNVKFTIEDTPWNAVTLNQELRFIRIAYKKLNTSYTRYFANEQTLRTNNPAGNDYDFMLTTLYKDHNTFHMETVSNPVPDKLTITLNGDVLKLALYAFWPNNIKDKFEATVRVWSDANPTHKETLTFIYDPDFTNPDPAHH